MLFLLVASPFVGSFLGVLIRRLPVGRPVALGRSACEACGAVLRMRDLVPLVSFLALAGRCRSCGERIPWNHLAIEIAAIGVAVWAALAGDGVYPAAAACVLGWGLLALAWIDWEHLLLPDALTLPLAVLGLILTWIYDPGMLADHGIAALAGYGTLRLVGAAYERLRGREGLGQGDAKLLGAAGAWVGLGGLPWVLLGGALIGLCGALLAMARGGRLSATTAVPFGPSLACATWIVFLIAQ